MTISDIWFKDFSGTTSAKNEPYVGSLVCSSSSVSAPFPFAIQATEQLIMPCYKQCSDIYASDINVLPPDGTAPKWICSGFNTSGLEGFDCSTSQS